MKTQEISKNEERKEKMPRYNVKLINNETKEVLVETLANFRKATLHLANKTATALGKTITMELYSVRTGTLLQKMVFWPGMAYEIHLEGRKAHKSAAQKRISGIKLEKLPINIVIKNKVSLSF